MKTHTTALATLCLAAIAAAESLPSEDVPLACANICGPIVELTSICSPGPKKAPARKRQQDDGGQGAEGDQLWVPKLAVQPEGWHEARGHDGLAGREIVEGGFAWFKRAFSVIVPAPTTFPPEVTETAPTGGLDLRPSRVTRVTPVVKPSPAPPAAPPPPPPPPPPPSPKPTPPPADPKPSSSTPEEPPKQTPPPPAAAESTPRTRASVPSSTTTSSSEDPSKSPTGDDDGAGDGTQPSADQKGWSVGAGGAEEKCVCLNTSFDVAKVAGLCASCMSQVDSGQNDLRVIMSVCNFSTQQYTPSDDKVVNNVRVKANKPTAMVGQNASVAGRASVQTPSVAAAWTMVLLGFAVSLC